LFAKKSRNIINIISMISMVVVAFVTAAMIVVLSAFSGIESLVEKLFANFDAPITILPEEGKWFSDSLLTQIHLDQNPDVAKYSPVILEDAWLTYAGFNAVATLKGVSSDYTSVSPIDSMTYMGRFSLKEDSTNFCVLGLGIKSELRVPVNDLTPSLITINAPIRGRKLSRYRENAFNKSPILVSGVFSVNAELDSKFVFVPFDYAQELFGLQNQISAVEIKTHEGVDIEEATSRLRAQLPKGLKAVSRFEKNALVYKTNASEKWATFLILLFILVIACFNIIASLTMLIIEKKNDIKLLGSLGATPRAIERIFVMEGIFINGLGAVIGTVLGLTVCFAQQKLGLVRMEGAMVEHYPVLIKPVDVLGIFITVSLVGSLFSATLVRTLMKRFALRTSA
jgi:lipoprotein-releasing system permease protein